MLTSEEKMKQVVFFVEANSYETGAIWSEIKQYVRNRVNELTDIEELQEMYFKSLIKEILIQDYEGFWTTIGHINGETDKPVCVSFSFIQLYGSYVCFYNATSRYVDHTMVEDYIKSNYPTTWDNGHRNPAMTDAMNFHHALHECVNICKTDYFKAYK